MSDFTSIPNLNDKYAKIKERMHSSGAKVIEVLYGATDDYGNPTYPTCKEDGHGHVIALEIDGIFQVLCWRHSRDEGGEYDFGYSRSEHPLADLENDIKEKQSILDEANEVMSHEGYDPLMVDTLLDRFDSIFDMNTPVEQRQKKKYNEIKDANNKKRRKIKKYGSR